MSDKLIILYDMCSFPVVEQKVRIDQVFIFVELHWLNLMDAQVHFPSSDLISFTNQSINYL